MSIDKLIASTTENYFYLEKFRNGDEDALKYVYAQVYRPLMGFGRKIITDRFVVQTLVQEAILKCWEFRQNMESMFHIYCFMRMNLRWGCLGYYKKPVNRFHYRLHFAEQDDYFVDPDTDDTANRLYHEERMQLIETALPYLPPNCQTVIKLYRRGFSLKKIAKQMGSSSKGVHLEVQKSICFLKKMIESGREPKAVERPPRAKEQYAECMEAMMWQLYKMRYDQKMDFSVIAEQLNLPLAEVVQQYAAAHAIIKSVKKKIGDR